MTSPEYQALRAQVQGLQGAVISIVDQLDALMRHLDLLAIRDGVAPQLPLPNVDEPKTDGDRDGRA
jgi:hypothetical protein